MTQNTAQLDPKKQQLKEQLEHMVQAFDEFHSTIVDLKKQQQDVAKHIRAQIDQKKIDQIHSLLKQL